ncbi:EF-hand domain-containing protein [Ostreiculturibacter nitratireducens]|uniref:EF-hand domain-containing protein n=1 Tax=Ostreiculturibacter nitratireducens TaxID=3075226 RepID=UPI0031B62246
MKEFALTLGAVVAIAAAQAQAQTMVADADGDGVYSMEEMLAAYPDLTEETFAAIDANADGSVDADELQAAVEAGTLPG